MRGCGTPLAAGLLGAVLACGTAAGATLPAAPSPAPETGVTASRPAPSAPGEPSSWGANQARFAPSSTSGPSSSGSSGSSGEGVTAATAAAGPDWVFRGAGWGHGIGMSQYGAMEMARDGYSAAQILGHYYTGTTYDAVADTAVISVNLRNGVSTTSLTTSALSTGGGAIRLTAGGTTAVMTGKLGATVTVVRSGSSAKATCTSCTPVTTLSGTFIQATWNDGRTLLDVDGTRYLSGTLVVWPSPSASTTLEVTNKVRLHDEYLDYLREVPWSWPLEAKKAQAAAARGYALSQSYKDSCKCHLFDDTRSQVYGGYPSASDLPYWSGWQQAVRATGTTTTGYVTRYAGAIIQAFYSSSSGGRTQNNEDVWGGTPLPYLRSVSDPWSVRSSNPNASWRTVITGGSLASAFGLSDVAKLDLHDRTAGNGVDVATATSAAGASATIDGESLRSRLGLKGTWVRHLVSRVDGANRYDVAANVAKRISVSATSAVIASGESAAVFDASVSGPLSAAVDGPLLLTAKGALPAPTMAELDRRKASLKTVYIVGGAGSVSEAVRTQLEQRYAGLTVTRIAGASRYEVAENVAKEIKARHSVSTVIVASGTAIADALGASGPASALGYPILLTYRDSVPADTLGALDATGATIAHIVGGEASVAPAVESYLTDTRSMTVRRHGGASRYEVAANVATYFRPRFSLPNEIVMTSGANAALADSLAAGSLKRLMVLTAPSAVPEATLAVFQTTPQLETVVAVGGAASVPAARLVQAQSS